MSVFVSCSIILQVRTPFFFLSANTCWPSERILVVSAAHYSDFSTHPILCFEWNQNLDGTGPQRLSVLQSKEGKGNIPLEMRLIDSLKALPFSLCKEGRRRTASTEHSLASLSLSFWTDDGRLEPTKIQNAVNNNNKNKKETKRANI